GTPPITFYGIQEGNGNVFHNEAFKVHLAAPAGPGGVHVHYQTVSLSARSPDDFTSVSGDLFIPGGFDHGDIQVPIFGDNTPELSETFAVRLTNSSGATLAAKDSTAIATIYDDDKVPITGKVFYDWNGNGFKDLDEGGIGGVNVTIKWSESGT